MDAIAVMDATDAIAAMAPTGPMGAMGARMCIRKKSQYNRSNSSAIGAITVH